MELTAAEQELIRLKRIEDDNKKQQDALKQQLEYDKLLRNQSEYINKEKQRLIKLNETTTQFYNQLVENGVEKYVSLDKNHTTKIEYYSHAKEILKPEDWVVLEVDLLKINTKYGLLGSIDSSMKAKLPYSLSDRYQSYVAKTVAQKIKNKIANDLELDKEKQKLVEAKEQLIHSFSTEFPTAKFVCETKDEYSAYSRQSYKRHYITINFQNGSWVKILYNSNGDWRIDSKFDSKYIKPETKEEWLTYLNK